MQGHFTGVLEPCSDVRPGTVNCTKNTLTTAITSHPCTCMQVNAYIRPQHPLCITQCTVLAGSGWKHFLVFATCSLARRPRIVGIRQDNHRPSHRNISWPSRSLRPHACSGDLIIETSTLACCLRQLNVSVVPALVAVGCAVSSTRISDDLALTVMYELKRRSRYRQSLSNEELRTVTADREAALRERCRTRSGRHGSLNDD